MSMRQKGKWLSILLAASTAFSSIGLAAPKTANADTSTVAAGTPYEADGTYNVNLPHIVINQVYGFGSAASDGKYVSNGFIELFNQTDEDVDLSKWSLQYVDVAAAAEGTAWKKLNLSGIIKANSSFLVIGAKSSVSGLTGASLDISAPGAYDQQWTGLYIGNKQLKVALMSNQTALTTANPYDPANPAPGYVDLVGTADNDATSTIDGYETEYPGQPGQATATGQGISKKKSIRRVQFADSDNNRNDFAQVDYSGSVAPELLPGNSGNTSAALSIRTSSLPNGQAGQAYSSGILAVDYDGNKANLSFSAAGLPSGLHMDGVTGEITGTPDADDYGQANVTVSVTDGRVSPATRDIPLYLDSGSILAPAPEDSISIEKIAGYSVGYEDPEGGVAEIVKYNGENGKLYLVNGATKPSATLDIVSLKAGQSTLTRDGDPINVEALSKQNDPDFEFGDLTSVDIDTANDTIVLAVQEADAMKNGKILVLDYAGNYIREYETGVQPDMVKVTKNGRYILTADEGEPRTAAGDPDGSVTIVDTTTNTTAQVKFDNPAVVDDSVIIRGSSNIGDPKIHGRSNDKADLQHDAEPEFISLSADEKMAYVSLQENNAIAQIDIATKSLKQVNGLGLKDFSLPQNSLDLLKDSSIRLENVPFYGVYMPDGIATYTVGGKTYVLTANEGDATEWEARDNASTIGDMKMLLDPDSKAAKFLANKTAYDGTEVMSSMDNEGLYLYGARSFSIWDTTATADDGTLAQVFDSGNDFERITATRLPANFNGSHDDPTMDKRSSKKGPEPEYVKVGQVGSKTLAFVGLERIGGIMTYDITNPKNPKFVNYINTRKFNKIKNAGETVTGSESDTGPEGIDFIPASLSPTKYPLLLVANEVGGTVSVLQINEGKYVSSPPGGGIGGTDSGASGSTTEPKAPVAANGVVSTVAEAKLDSNGKATAVITAEQVNEALKALSAASPALEFKTDAKGMVKEATVSLPANALANIAASSASAARIDTGIGTIELDSYALDAVASAAKQDAVSFNVQTISAASLPGNAHTQAIGNRPVYQLTITTSSGSTISTFGKGTATVSLPYTPAPGEDPNAIVVYYVASNGEATAVKNAAYDPASGQVKFRVSHFSTYAVGYNKVTFTDTANGSANEAITYLAARGLINGTGAGKFSPDAKLSRADFAVLLARIAGQSENGSGSAPFGDVSPNAYYAQAVQWAAANGIIQGTGNGRFDPKANVTREQIALISERLLKVLDESVPSDLIDSSKAAATRAEAALALYKLVRKLNG
ncbi:choice-of-anchor I family protein [Cohnella sp. AR92]|uniref:choice-of-anchor I family protein n=1 Tax=Cohnella sp. AR92 TaxID=648716 RepID=UPI000F8DB2A8|nr:choice-of-anchor I family protein [Cohnella sp. AR92]RUS48802.1 hypothetical protein ELR57_00170 [Cohnella sp. AR92]